MSHYIEQYDDYAVISHTSYTLEKSDVEFTFSDLTDMARYKWINGVICDYSSVNNIELTDNDILEISNALVIFFKENEAFKMVEVSNKKEVINVLKKFKIQLERLGIDRLYIVKNKVAAIRHFE